VNSNGGNPRLDRIEKLIEQGARESKEAHARFERDLRRWAALGVKEARSQRKRTREIDESITRLAAAQLVTEEKLDQTQEKLDQLAAAQLVTEEKLQRLISFRNRN
jgi:hypothetical protein